MNRKAQVPILAVMFGVMVMLYFWAMWAGPQLAETSQQIIEDNGYTGLTAFFWSYINLWVFIGLLIGIAIAAYLGG